ncbi:uncharacterized protein J8A68_000981 [[Candida] subhashii]|uniref:CFEM domain-containing protein n=1 Tax=[Candida] subhashii TaxID=561895 RepID=A0A8J5QGY8_9ASCO|nr:uncharacterized protein J8A68_000981 [[Candida] subhashii]KAG7665579.1 hypothetical protein J8A68_000981 [[Candida] subhashii]
MNYITVLLGLFISSFVFAEDYATYPQVPKTASINGFADPIVDLLPSCAQDCVKFDTGNTPCPYWDTGCFCVMPQWAGLMGQCVAQNCEGNDVEVARYLATSLCNIVGANTWMMPASISDALSSAAGTAEPLTTLDAEIVWVISSTTSVQETGSASSTSNSSEDSTSTGNLAALQTGSITSLILGFVLSLLTY